MLLKYSFNAINAIHILMQYSTLQSVYPTVSDKLSSTKLWARRGLTRGTTVAGELTGHTPQGTRLNPVDGTRGTVARYSLCGSASNSPPTCPATIVTSAVPSYSKVSRIVCMLSTVRGTCGGVCKVHVQKTSNHLGENVSAKYCFKIAFQHFAYICMFNYCARVRLRMHIIIRMQYFRKKTPPPPPHNLQLLDTHNFYCTWKRV